MARKAVRKKSSGKVSQRFTAWSFSRLSDYEQCPRRARYRHLDKLPEGEPGAALVRGSAIHEEGEKFLKGELKRVPKSYQAFAKELRALRKGQALSEDSWAFTSAWESCDWFGAAVWCRMKVDALLQDNAVVDIVDFKTGRIRGRNDPQLDLYALGALLKFKAARVRASFWYLDSGDIIGFEYSYEELPTLQDYWRRRTKPMLSDTKFEATPGDHCKWCAFGKSKGGPCEFG